MLRSELTSTALHRGPAGTGATGALAAILDPSAWRYLPFRTRSR